MINLTNIDVSAYNPRNGILITWEFEPTTEDLSNYSLDIYRSETPGYEDSFTDYELIASGISANTYFYYDSDIIGIFDLTRTWFYKFSVNNILTSFSDIQPKQPVYRTLTRDDYQHAEILYRKNLVMQKKVGRDFHLLKRRTWGTHCSKCWDKITQRTNNPDCPVCYGTGWIDGYFSPIPITCEVNPAPKYTQIQMFGEWKPSDVMLVMLDYPQLNAKDIIVDDKDKRWIVNQIQYLEKLGKLIEQRAQIQLIAADDIVYSMPLESALFFINPDTINFTAYQNGELPSGQFVRLINTSNYIQSWTSVPKTNWLAITPGSGINSTTVEVKTLTTDLLPRKYTGSILVNEDQFIAVNYIIKESPEIFTSPFVFYFDNITTSGILTVSTRYIEDMKEYSISKDNSSWFDYTIAGMHSYNVYINQILPSGIYSGIITIVMSGMENSPLDIGVFCTIS